MTIIRLAGYCQQNVQCDRIGYNVRAKDGSKASLWIWKSQRCPYPSRFAINYSCAIGYSNVGKRHFDSIIVNIFSVVYFQWRTTLARRCQWACFTYLRNGESEGLRWRRPRLANVVSCPFVSLRSMESATLINSSGIPAPFGTMEVFRMIAGWVNFILLTLTLVLTIQG